MEVPSQARVRVAPPPLVGNAFVLITSNVSGLAGLDELSSDSSARKCQAVCFQEHHQISTASLEHILRKSAWGAK
eukprot:3398887-Pyramimonas_sp.AAC.1